MADLGVLTIEHHVQDSSSRALKQQFRGEYRLPVDVLKTEQVPLTGAAFTALSPPTGADMVIIDVGTNASLILKGETGDTGIALTPAAGAFGVPAVLPISSPSIGIHNEGSACTVLVQWCGKS